MRQGQPPAGGWRRGAAAAEWRLGRPAGGGERPRAGVWRRTAAAEVRTLAARVRSAMGGGSGWTALYGGCYGSRPGSE